MVNRLSKIFVISGSIALILMDIWVIADLLQASGEALFNGLMWNMIPCGLLMGAVSLCAAFEVAAKKPLAIIASVIFGLTALIRALSLIVFVYDRSTLTDLDAMTYLEYTTVMELAGYMLLMVAAVFFMVYLINGKLRKTSVTLSGISFAVLMCGWLVNVYNIITDVVFYDGNILTAFVEIYSEGLVWSLVAIAAYVFVFACHTGVFEKSEKE